MARHSTMATSAQAKTKRLWYLEETICSGTGLINVLLMRLDCRASHHENRATSRRDHFPHTATVPVKNRHLLVHPISSSPTSPTGRTLVSPHLSWGDSRICETLATLGQREVRLARAALPRARLLDPRSAFFASLSTLPSPASDTVHAPGRPRSHLSTRSAFHVWHSSTSLSLDFFFFFFSDFDLVPLQPCFLWKK